MSLATEKPIFTLAQFSRMPDGIGFEVVEGELRDRNMSSLSSYIGGTVYFLLRGHVTAQRLGWVFPADNGYQCFPESPQTLRRPDVSFVRIERLNAEDIRDGWLRVVPDLVVEVVATHDLAYELEAKIDQYLRVGVPLIWVVIPPTRTVRIVRGDGSSALVRAGEELTGETIVPGFRCVVADLFLAAMPLPERSAAE